MGKDYLTYTLGRWLIGGGIAAGIMLAAPAFASAATLSLSPATGTYQAGQTFEVKIQLDTAGATTSGTDVYMSFDPGTLEVVDANSSATGTQILPGTLYAQTVANTADNTTGKIQFSGAKTSSSSGYSGSGTLATITFQALKAADATKVTFDFAKGATNLSEVLSNSATVLSSVADGTYAITAAVASPDPVASSSASGGGTDTGANGKGGTTGTGGTGTVAATGIDLNGYLILTIISFIGAGYFLTRRTKTR